MILTYRQDYGRIIDVPYSCSRMNQKWRSQDGKDVFNPVEEFGGHGTRKTQVITVS
jgi:hypothetical protein